MTDNNETLSQIEQHLSALDELFREVTLDAKYVHALEAENAELRMENEKLKQKGIQQARKNERARDAKEWSKTDAILRMFRNRELQAILVAEPRLIPIVMSAASQENTVGYHRITRYYYLKAKVLPLVGWESKNRVLKTQEAYDEVIGTIDDLLPPDDTDLYPDDVYPGSVGYSEEREQAKAEYHSRVEAMKEKYNRDRHFELKDSGIHFYMVQLSPKEYDNRFIIKNGRTLLKTLSELKIEQMEDDEEEDVENIVEEVWPLQRYIMTEKGELSPCQKIIEHSHATSK